jgi:hypothetical protein
LYVPWIQLLVAIFWVQFLVEDSNYLQFQTNNELKNIKRERKREKWKYSIFIDMLFVGKKMRRGKHNETVICICKDTECNCMWAYVRRVFSKSRLQQIAKYNYSLWLRFSLRKSIESVVRKFLHRYRTLSLFFIYYGERERERGKERKRKKEREV